MVAAVVKHAQASIFALADDNAPCIEFIMRSNEPDQFPYHNFEQKWYKPRISQDKFNKNDVPSQITCERVLYKSTLLQ